MIESGLLSGEQAPGRRRAEPTAPQPVALLVSTVERLDDAARAAARSVSEKASGPYVVVETTYPTTYGCYRGRSWSRAEMICRSQVDTHGPFKNQKSAQRKARDVLDSTCHFEDWESVDEDLFASGPPWDSAEMGNYDNDEEVRIEVKTYAEHEQCVSADEAHIAKARGKAVFEQRLREEMLQRQVTTAGRVHYSRPAQPYDIKADLEVEYSPSLLAAKLRLAFAKGSGRKLGSASPVLALSADVLEKVAARSAASNWVLSQPGFGTVHARTGSSLADSPDVVVNSVKTLMFRVAERVPPSESVLEPLAVLASRCPRLEEIHYVEDLGARRDMTAVIEDLLHEAPHLRATLKLLRLGGRTSAPTSSAVSPASHRWSGSTSRTVSRASTTISTAVVTRSRSQNTIHTICHSTRWSSRCASCSSLTWGTVTRIWCGTSGTIVFRGTGCSACRGRGRALMSRWSRPGVGRYHTGGPAATRRNRKHAMLRCGRCWRERT